MSLVRVTVVADSATLQSRFEMHDSVVFYEIAAILALASAIGLLGLLLRQPLIVAFIATGIVAGPDVLGLVETSAHIGLLAEIGIAVLLFLVGLKLDLQIVRTLGAVALATGLGQVAFTAGIGFLICLALGIGTTTSIYIAVALTFSSTIIIVKLLTDKREVDSLHGRIAIGFLIVQDIVVVVAMIALSTIGVGAGGSPAGLGIVGVLGSGALLVGIVLVFVRFGAEPLLRRIARMPELLVTFALGWAVLFAAICDFIGLGKELGGLIAGVSLASTSFREAIASRLSSLRDFLLLFFFIGLGAGLRVGTLGDQIPVALTLSAFVLIGNPLIVMLIMGFMAMGVTLGHVADEAIGLVTLVGLVTITLSTYMILYSHTLYGVLEPYIGWSERRIAHRENASEPTGHERYDVILFGLGRYGRELAKIMHNGGAKVLGVDFDPEALERWRKRGLPGVYGDADDPEFPTALPLASVQWAVIATSPLSEPSVVHHDTRIVLMEALREAGFGGRVAIRSHDPVDARRLLHAGADLVLEPFADAARRAGEAMGFVEVAGPGESAGRASRAPVA